MALNSTIKDDINRLVVPVKQKTVLPAVPSASPIGSQRGSGKPSQASSTTGGGGPVSPIDMVITKTIVRSIPVPPGATSVEVEDATEFSLIDAKGVTYQVKSVKWPS